MSGTTPTTWLDDFQQKLSDPDKWDVAGAAVGGIEQFCNLLGRAAARLQDAARPLTLIEIQQMRATFVAAVEQIKFFGTLADASSAAPALPEERSIHRQVKAIAVQVDALLINVSKNIQAAEIGGLTADRAQTIAREWGQIASKFVVLLGVAQVAEAYKSGGTSLALEKTAGFLGGWAGGALAGAGAAAIVGSAAVATAPAWVVLGAAVLATTGVVLIGYGAGKASEAAWRAARDLSESLVPADTAMWVALSSQLDAVASGVGELDGTWLEATELTAAQKANFSAAVVLAGAGVEPTTALLADLNTLFSSSFAADELLERDKALALLIEVARESGPDGYTTQRVAVDGNQVAIDIPPAATRARDALRSLIEASVSPAEQPYVSLTLPSQLIISLGGGTRTAGAGGALMGGSSVAETLDGGTGADVLLGEAGADTLNGGDRYDTLFGGADDDILVGGAGSDYLLGGTGADRYEFAAGHGSDTIVDSDGQGTLWFEGQRITGGKKVDDAYWISDDGRFGFTRVANGNGGFDLIVSRGSGFDQIRIRNWAGGQMGITLADEPAYPPAARTPFGGDFVKKVRDDDPTRYLFDGFGNYVPDPFGLPGPQHDLITGTSGGDEISGGQGNDGLSGYAGDDVINGGELLDTDRRPNWAVAGASVGSSGALLCALGSAS